MYVYDCNSILITTIKNISEKYMIRDFTEFTTDFTSRVINPVFLFRGQRSINRVENGNYKHGYQLPVVSPY